MSSDSGLSRLQIPVQQPWFTILSPLQRALLGFAVAALIFVSGGVLDWFVTRQYLPRISLMLAGIAIAMAGGLLVFRILTDIQSRYQAMLDRLGRIAELNHHIRNALQVIAYHNVPQRTERVIEQVNAEVVRIESVLREVSASLGDTAGFSAPAILLVKQRSRQSG
jgi:hypothetical protein